MPSVWKSGWMYALGICVLTGCGSEGVDIGNGDPIGPITDAGNSDAAAPLLVDVEGSVQKGPFIEGTSITIAELTAGLRQTGRTFSTTLSKSGTFSLRGVQLISPYARVEAHGYYFDEVRGKISDSELKLFTYVNLSDQTSVNINVLGYLEAARIEHLVASGASFAQSKATAHTEVLKVFGMEGDIAAAETLDISKAGEANAKLLAISTIVQGRRTVGDLSELLSSVQVDLSSDGTLDDGDLGSALVDGATVPAENVRNNLIERYRKLGVTASVPEFAEHLAHFTATTSFEPGEGSIRYPARVDVSPGYSENNLLSYGDGANVPPGTLSFAAYLPAETALKVRITVVAKQRDGSGLSWGCHPPPGWSTSAPCPTNWSGLWTPASFEPNAAFLARGVLVGTYELRDDKEGLTESVVVGLQGTATALIEYFEYGAATPSRTAVVSWTGGPLY